MTSKPLTVMASIPACFTTLMGFVVPLEATGLGSQYIRAGACEDQSQTES